MNEALRTSILFAYTEAPPDFGAAALDEVLAVRVVMAHELDDIIRPIAVTTLITISPTVPIDETVDRRLDFAQPLARTELDRQVEEQMAMHHLSLPA